MSFGSKFGLQDWYSENNDATKAVQRFAMRLLESTSVEAKTEAMIQMGHTAFIGGKQATREAVKWGPLFIDVLRSPKYINNFSMQVRCCYCCILGREPHEVLFEVQVP